MLAFLKVPECPRCGRRNADYASIVRRLNLHPGLKQALPKPDKALAAQ